MASGYKVKLIGADILIKIFKGFPDIFYDEIKAPLKKIGSEVERNAKDAAPVHMGILRSSIVNEVKVGGGQAYVKIAPSLGKEVYPVVMEYGRRPGAKPPPVAALIRWVELVIRPAPQELVGLTYVIARSIGRKGIKGREYMKKGLENSEGKFADWVADAARKMVERIVRGT